MVDTPFAAAALRAAPASLGVGLHAVLDPAADVASAEAGLRAQLSRFRALRGGAPTHVDSHKHAHARPAVLDAVARVASEQRLPVRALDEGMRRELRRRGVRAADRFVGDATLRPAWTLDRLLAALAGLGDGVTELMTHPGHAPAFARTSFGAEREIELAALCHPEARALLATGGVRLGTYAEISSAIFDESGP
jgi:predicted glycoside hydrolase/deacetylase ChbG (UPF0249 family)